MSTRIITLKPFTYMYPNEEPMPEKLLVMDFTTSGAPGYFAKENPGIMFNEFIQGMTVTVDVDGYEYEITYTNSRRFDLKTDAETTIGNFVFVPYGYDPMVTIGINYVGVHRIKVYVSSDDVALVNVSLSCSGDYTDSSGFYAHVFENGVATPKFFSAASSVTFKMLCYLGQDGDDEYAMGYLLDSRYSNQGQSSDLTYQNSGYWEYDQSQEEGRYPTATASFSY